MARSIANFVVWLTNECPRWLMVLISAVLVAAGVGCVWLVGHYDAPKDVAVFGFFVIGIGIGGFALGILRDKSNYNF